MTNIIDAAEADIAKVATTAEHAAAWVLGIEAIAENDVQQLEASSPLIADAIALAQSYVVASPTGVAIETTAEEVLALVKKIDATSPPTTAPVAGSPADPVVIAAAPPVVAKPAVPSP
jgi:hypothetical protein